MSKFCGDCDKWDTCERLCERLRKIFREEGVPDLLRRARMRIRPGTIWASPGELGLAQWDLDDQCDDDTE